MVAVSFVWKAGTMVDAAEQDLKIDCVIVLQCFGASCFCSPQLSSSCLGATSFLNFVCPVFPFKSPLFFSLSPVCLSLPFSFYLPFNYVLFDIFAATAPFWGVDIQKYLVGRGAQGWHVGEEFKFSYQRCLIFVWLLFIYLLEQDVLGSCLESLF